MARPWLFDLGASLYGLMTAQQTWRLSCARLVAYFPLPRESRPLRVVDLGCGPGVSTITLARSSQAHVFGLDLAPRMLTLAQSFTARANLDGSIGYVLADAARLPFADGALDMLTGHSFLYLVPNRHVVVAEAFRVLRSGGRIASMEPQRSGSVWHAAVHHWREFRYLVSVLLWRPYSRWHGQFSDDDFKEVLRQAGFSKTSTESVLDGLGIIGCGEKP